ncbi:MAG TPA: hypothetical protein VI248_07470 [Kineosporiaceae bacterium]
MMTWNTEFRRARITALGTAIVAGAVGAAVLAGPLAGAQAAYPESYPNGALCYQHPDGQENKSRIQVTEIKYKPSDPFAWFSKLSQKWDGNSNQYRDDPPAGEIGIGKSLLIAKYGDPNAFCYFMTASGDETYPYGVWTSRHEPGGSPAPGPGPTPSGSPRNG